MKKNILLAITGLSPQVVTETLYGIAQSRLEWPDEIQIITTKKGKEQARLGLITETKNTKSTLERFCTDYKMPMPKLLESDIYVVPNSEGNEVDDARSVDDQEALADFILKHVGNLCELNQIRLHASIAGGRKTMTFFLGYAMTLFARAEDRLSHVLVDEDFENNREFYYPTPYTQVIPGRLTNQKLNTKDASVILTEIPFIRQRNQIRPEVYQSLKNESYRDMTRMQNLAYLNNIELVLDIADVTLTVKSGDVAKTMDFKASLLEFAFCLYAVRLNKIGIAMTRLNDGDYDKDEAQRYMQELDRLHGFHPTKGHYDQLLNLRNDHLSGRTRTIKSLKYGLSNTFVDQRKNTLKKKLRSVFPADFVDVISGVVEYQTGLCATETRNRVTYNIVEGDYRPYPVK